jgi:hypothetical protein
MISENGTEVINVVERFSFNLGSAIQCIARAEGKPGSGILADLEEAQRYLEREIKRIEQRREESVSLSPSPASRPASPVYQLGKSQRNGGTWQDKMGDKFRFCNGAWEYQTAGQGTWEPVRFAEILTDFGPYTLVVQGEVKENQSETHLPVNVNG